MTAAWIWTQLTLAGVAALAALAVPARWRSAAAGSAVALQGVAGVVTAVLVLDGGSARVELAPDGLPLAALGSLTLAPDALGAFFLLVVSAVAAVAAVFGVGYAHGAVASRTGWLAFTTFVLGLQLVPQAGDAVAFLMAWELMALGSTALVLADHRERPEVRGAGLWYASMTHLSFLLLLSGFGVLAAQAGSIDLAAMAADPPTGGPATVAWLLLVAGFLTKAGAVPVHVWLPRAHPEAPSHVSAVMSAAMVKTGVYGVLLVGWRLLPDGPRWWSITLLVVGLVSALYGILQASVASDLKRLLAYSTTENVGLIVSAIALGELFTASGRPEIAAVAALAAALLVVSHATFKTTLFLGAGSVLHASGERDLDRLGGLGPRMPVTSAAFAVGALGAAALPLSAGFVAEWVLLQALINGDARTDRVVAVLLPAAMGVVALTAGLALLTFVKAFGIGFLARPRSDGAAAAHEGGWSMRAALVVAAGSVLALGLVPGPLAAFLAPALSVGGAGSTDLAGLELPGIDATLDPVALGLVAVLSALPVLLAAALLRRHAPRRAVDLGWGCGGARSSPRMQYTATSYAEPLVRVFGHALEPRRELEVQHYEESRHLIHGIAFTQEVSDIVEDRLYSRPLRVVGWLGDRARGLQNGSIHRYLGYSFTALVVVLLAASW